MEYYSSGKILVSGEYAVLDGAQALALPTKSGQSLSVNHMQDGSFHHWQSLDHRGDVWFECTFDLSLTNTIHTSDIQRAQTLLQILRYIKVRKADLFNHSLQFITKLDFNPEWGLGSSATFIHNLAQWSGVHAFDLLQISFGGSGYDLAVALANTSITYHIDAQKPQWEKVKVDWDFKDQLWFVYLNQKQNSREGIRQYKAHPATQMQIEQISKLTKQFLSCSDLTAFKKLINQHESLISNIIQLKPVKEKIFPDYEGSIKSLGAWGGDFVLATGSDAPAYFKEKGYETIIPYKAFIKE